MRSARTTCRFSRPQRFPSSPPSAWPRLSDKKSKSPIAVSDARGLRTLHVGGEAIQSAMRLDDPHALALDYTRCMMAFLLLQPEPREFYDAAFLALREPGVLVINYMDDDPKFDQNLQRLERAFGGAVLAMPALYDPNILAFAFRGAPASIAWSTLRTRAEKLEARY